MAKCKTAVTPVLMHWSYCSLAWSHWINVADTHPWCLHTSGWLWRYPACLASRPASPPSCRGCRHSSCAAHGSQSAAPPRTAVPCWTWIWLRKNMKYVHMSRATVATYLWLSSTPSGINMTDGLIHCSEEDQLKVLLHLSLMRWSLRL